MNPQTTMNQLIDIFFTSISSPSATLRERYFLRESLYSLQRLSLSQHKLEMDMSIKKNDSYISLQPQHQIKKTLESHEEHAAAKNKSSSGHQNP